MLATADAALVAATIAVALLLVASPCGGLLVDFFKLRLAPLPERDDESVDWDEVDDRDAWRAARASVSLWRRASEKVNGYPACLAVSGVRASQLRWPDGRRRPPSAYRSGADLEARFKGGASFHSARILSGRADGTFDVLYRGRAAPPRERTASTLGQRAAPAAAVLARLSCAAVCGLIAEAAAVAAGRAPSGLPGACAALAALLVLASPAPPLFLVDALATVALVALWLFLDLAWLLFAYALAVVPWPAFAGPGGFAAVVGLALAAVAVREASDPAPSPGALGRGVAEGLPPGFQRRLAAQAARSLAAAAPRRFVLQGVFAAVGAGVADLVADGYAPALAAVGPFLAHALLRAYAPGLPPRRACRGREGAARCEGEGHPYAAALNAARYPTYAALRLGARRPLLPAVAAGDDDAAGAFKALASGGKVHRAALADALAVPRADAAPLLRALRYAIEDGEAAATDVLRLFDAAADGGSCGPRAFRVFVGAVCGGDDVPRTLVEVLLGGGLRAYGHSVAAKLACLGRAACGRYDASIAEAWRLRRADDVWRAAPTNCAVLCALPGAGVVVAKAAELFAAAPLSADGALGGFDWTPCERDRRLDARDGRALGAPDRSRAPAVAGALATLAALGAVALVRVPVAVAVPLWALATLPSQASRAARAVADARGSPAVDAALDAQHLRRAARLLDAAAAEALPALADVVFDAALVESVRVGGRRRSSDVEAPARRLAADFALAVEDPRSPRARDDSAPRAPRGSLASAFFADDSEERRSPPEERRSPPEERRWLPSSSGAPPGPDDGDSDDDYRVVLSTRETARDRRRRPRGSRLAARLGGRRDDLERAAVDAARARFDVGVRPLLEDDLRRDRGAPRSVVDGAAAAGRAVFDAAARRVAAAAHRAALRAARGAFRGSRPLAAADLHAQMDYAKIRGDLRACAARSLAALAS